MQANGAQEERPVDQTVSVFGDPNKEERPTLSVGIVGLEVDTWEEIFPELQNQVPEPLHQAEAEPPPPPLSAQPPGYTRDTLAPSPEDPAPEAIAAVAPCGTTAKNHHPLPRAAHRLPQLPSHARAAPCNWIRQRQTQSHNSSEAPQRAPAQMLQELAFSLHRRCRTPLCNLHYAPARRIQVPAQRRHLGVRMQSSSK